MIIGANLCVYSNDGNEAEFPLSSLQLETICKILGIKHDGGETFSCFSDESLKTFMDRTVNRFKEVT